ncbi:hypothetical protein BH09MYX1_BH09MYX1_07990 [soil metagenome]
MIVLWVVGLFGAGCARDPLPQLLTVRDVTPREVELGDRLEVAGAGFAQGRPAHVHLHGMAMRPGDDPEPVEIELAGDVITPERIEIAVDDAVIGKIWGTGVHAAHTTFEGTAEVLFAATTEGAPPVTGIASHITLDAYPPSTPRAALEARADEGARFLKSAGLHLRGEADSFVVESIDQGSAGARSGVLPDDVVVASSGVRVASLGDFAPPPSALSVPMSFRRGASEHEETRVIALGASAAPLSQRLLVPALLVALAMLVVLFGASAPGRVVPWLRRRLHEGPRGAILREIVPPGALARYLLPAFALALALAAPMLPSFDALAIVLAVVFGRVVARLTRAGGAAGESRAGALAALASGAPLLVIAFGTILTTGARSAEEISAAMESAPLACAAFRSPVHLALAAIALFSGIAPALGPSKTMLEDPNSVRRGRFLSPWEWLAAWIQSALVVVFFFGGFRAGGAPLAIAGTLFALKTAALFAVAVALRSAVSRQAPGKAMRSALLRVLPAALGLAVVARLWEEHIGARIVQMGVTVVTVATAVALFVALVRKPANAQRVGLDPFR